MNFSDSVQECSDGGKYSPHLKPPSDNRAVPHFSFGQTAKSLVKQDKHDHDRQSKSANNQPKTPTAAATTSAQRRDELDVEKLTVAGDPQEQEEPRNHDWGGRRG